MNGNRFAGRVRFGAGLVLALPGIAACSAEAADDTNDVAESVDVDGLEAQQLITHANTDGTWTANATATKIGSTMSGVTTFGGPTGKTRKMGFCLLHRYGSTTCSGDPNNPGQPNGTECNSAPSDALLPAGGSRYCVAPNGSGTKYCFYRPGYEATFCKGTPVTGLAIAPQTLSVGITPAATGAWAAYACFEGCIGLGTGVKIPGSVSPIAAM